MTLHVIDLNSGELKGSTYLPDFECETGDQGMFPPVNGGLLVNEKTGEVYYHYAATQGMGIEYCLHSIHRIDPSKRHVERMVVFTYKDFQHCLYNGILFSQEDQNIIIGRDSSLYVYNVESGHGRQVNFTGLGSSGLSALAPGPSGKKVVYGFFNPPTRVPTGGQTIKKIDVSTGTTTNVTHFEAEDQKKSYPVAFSLDESSNTWTLVNLEEKGDRGSTHMSLYNFDFGSGA